MMSQTQPWFAWPKLNPTQRRAGIVGAGLAGCYLARELAELGWDVELLNKIRAWVRGHLGTLKLYYFLSVRQREGTQPLGYYSKVMSIQRTSFLDGSMRVFKAHGLGL